MDATILVLIIVVAVLLIAIVAIGVIVFQRKRSQRLQERFGPEYERGISETGDRKAVEAELIRRQERRGELDIRDLRPAERSRFQRSWDSIQRGFVDDPTRALDEADILVVEVMRVRGYPVDDFERRADDISVDHPDVVHRYRQAHSVRDASADGSVNTEQQRHAITSYRLLIEALLGDTGADRSKSRATTTSTGLAIPGHPREHIR